jgi:hypothetical protein
MIARRKKVALAVKKIAEVAAVVNSTCVCSGSS